VEGLRQLVQSERLLSVWMMAEEWNLDTETVRKILTWFGDEGNFCKNGSKNF
jgi:hypothetical protein